MLSLRKATTEDLEIVSGWFNDERTFTMWSAGKFNYPPDKEQFQRYYGIFNSSSGFALISAVDEHETLSGSFSVRISDRTPNTGKLGFIVVSPELRGKGIGREMIMLACKYSFDVLKYDRVLLNVFSSNPRAYNCYTSAGFLPLETHNDAFIYKNETWNIIEMIKEKEHAEN